MSAAGQTRGLRLITDASPGISRRRAGRSFSYLRPSGAPVRDARTLERIRKLAIPPAWTDVWIATDPRAHLQATGRDARRRKQYRYHAEWSEARGAEKYQRLAAFARLLPSIRARVRQDLRRGPTTREQVLALLVTLLEATFVRVGNQEYTRANRSYGLTTLEDRHVRVSGNTIRFVFRGKGGKQRQVELKDRRLARLVKQCRDLRGKHLFQYVDAKGRRRPAHSVDLNAYIGRLADGRFTAKDFRTWGATLTAAALLDERGDILIGVPGRRALLDDLAQVAEELGNTVAVCRKSYVHPHVLAAYQDEKAWTHWQRTRRGRRYRGLAPREARLLRFLETKPRSGAQAARSLRTPGLKAS